MSDNIDVITELLIAQLLEDDLRNIAATKDAERTQLEEILSASSPSANDICKAEIVPPSQFNITQELFVAGFRLASDASLAESLRAQDNSIVANQQHAQKVAAGERKILLDVEFAKKLQDVLDNGEDAENASYDADSLLGHETIEEIFASDPNDKGKGKSTSNDTDEDPSHIHDRQSISSDWSNTMSKDNNLPAQKFPDCGICGDTIHETNSPILASVSANTSFRPPFGLRLPCPNQHSYCISCLSQYIFMKLDPNGNGGGCVESVVFPIQCPECPADQWPHGIEDDVAEKILGEKGMILWHQQRLLDSFPRHYCPNPRCSALVQIHEDVTNPQAICPSCGAHMCIPCKTLWHENFTCQEFQSLPLDERSLEDQQLLRLVKEKQWRRCPNCRRVIELAHGCNHLTCICKTHFCFKCGAPWNTEAYRCTRGEGCELWEDDDMLLEEGQRRGGGQVEEVIQPPVLVGAPIVPPPPYHAIPDEPEHDGEVLHGEFSWIADPAVVSTKHRFTGNMVQAHICGYCGRQCNSLADLRHHLSNVRRHPVYSCCGKFFRLRPHYQQHADMMIGCHHTILRDA